MPTTKNDVRPPRSGRGAVLIAIGIFASRLIGLVRQRAISHYFGLSTDAADAWAAGFRIPNLLQNLFGEGALSASFIPVYAGLLSQQKRREADAVAGTVGAILALAVSMFVFAGVLIAPWAIDLIAPGFHGEKRALTITIVRILFPGAGLLVLSAWCLGILNSHHRFLLSYAAPVIWSLAMIAALLWFGAQDSLAQLIITLAWASVAGSALQLLVQLPQVLRLAPALRVSYRDVAGDVRTVLRNAGPTLVSRGVIQISAYVDTIIASWLPLGAVAALANAQTIYTLPVSLFGMSISASELPAMSAVATGEAAVDALARRMAVTFRRLAFFVVPSAVGFLAFGDVVAAALFQTGRFSGADATAVWAILGGASIGLVASTFARLYASAFFALRDTKTPLRCASTRVLLTVVLGYLFAIPLPRWLGVDPTWGTAGLTASAGLAGWLEMWLLRRAFAARGGRVDLPASYVLRVWTAALAAAAVGWAIKATLLVDQPILRAAAVLVPFGIVFVLAALLLNVADALPRRFTLRAGGSR